MTIIVHFKEIGVKKWIHLSKIRHLWHERKEGKVCPGNNLEILYLTSLKGKQEQLAHGMR